MGGLDHHLEADPAEDLDTDDGQTDTGEPPAPAFLGIEEKNDDSGEKGHKDDAHGGGLPHAATSRSSESPGDGSKRSGGDLDGIEEKIETQRDEYEPNSGEKCGLSSF